MHLIQILLPLQSNVGKPFPSTHYLNIRDELTKKFGGLTSYARAPAEGLWKDDKNTTKSDDIVIFEVMAENLDKEWWANYKSSLKELFLQDEIIIRLQDIELL